MLRNRVLLISILVMGLALLLELAGFLIGERLEHAFGQAAERTRVASLNLELDAFAVRAAGEAASAYLTGRQEYAEEAREALDEARERLAALGEAERDSLAPAVLGEELLRLQAQVLERLAAGLAPLDQVQAMSSAERDERVEAVYAYEQLLPELRQRVQEYDHLAAEAVAAELDRWHGTSETLAVLRVLSLVLVVALVARLLTRRVVAPLDLLAGAARRVREGSFSVAVGEDGPGEIGVLQQSFNSMVARLGALNREAAERERQLASAVEAAEAASQAKTAFVANISHELRTPMHGVLGTADLLLKANLGAPQRRQVATIRSSAEALLAVINDVLDVSRLEAGRMELHFAPLSPRDLCESVVAIIQSRAQERQLELCCELTPDLPSWVLGDASRIRQVLMNLLGNAVKFTERGQVRLCVGLDPGKRGCLRFEVADSGPGIAPEAVERIFLPFEQADGSVSRRHGGTGLGLAISRLLVEAMGGCIQVASVPGEGSRFWFELPLSVCEAPPEPLASERGLTGGYTGCVLVVEDHPVNRMLAEAMLAELGCACEMVCNGREAVEAAARRRYDLIFMDCQMPEVDGFAATRLIRQAESGGERRVAIVAMTAGAMQSDRDAAQSAGMDDFLAKPFTVAELQAVLDRWLSRVS